MNLKSSTQENTSSPTEPDVRGSFDISYAWHTHPP